MTKKKSDLTETLEVVLAFDYDNFHTKSRFAPVQLKARHTAHTAHPMSYSQCSDSWLWHHIPPNPGYNMPAKYITTTPVP